MRKKRCIIEDEHERMGQQVGHCFHCGAKIGKTYKEKIEERANAVTIEQAQKILDLLHEGLSIGETCKAVELDTEVVCEIINRNIESAHFLRTEAKAI